MENYNFFAPAITDIQDPPCLNCTSQLAITLLSQPPDALTQLTKAAEIRLLQKLQKITFARRSEAPLTIIADGCVSRVDPVSTWHLSDDLGQLAEQMDAQESIEAFNLIFSHSNVNSYRVPMGGLQSPSDVDHEGNVYVGSLLHKECLSTMREVFLLAADKAGDIFLAPAAPVEVAAKTSSWHPGWKAPAYAILSMKYEAPPRGMPDPQPRQNARLAWDDDYDLFSGTGAETSCKVVMFDEESSRE